MAPLLQTVSAYLAFTLALGAQPVITSFSPSVVNAGDTITIQGSGFTGTTAVEFSDRMNNFVPAESITVVSDQEIRAKVPFLMMIHSMDRSRIMVQSPSGLAVTFPQTAVEVTSGYDLGGSGSAYAIVRTGGALNAEGGGANTIYVASGGSVTITQGGGLYFLESGAYADFTNVSGHVFHTSSAIFVRPPLPPSS